MIGSIPAAYIFIKKKHGKDITLEGSGNVGTLNAFQVSKSKSTMFFVLAFDILKGAVPVWILLKLFPLQVVFVLVSAFFIILGHIFSVWLKFKGGRGLAAATGIFACCNYFIVPAWCIIWLIVFFLFKRDVMIANFTATLLFPFFPILFSDFFIGFYIYESLKYNLNYFYLFSFLISVTILSRHVEIFRKINFKTV